MTNATNKIRTGNLGEDLACRYLAGRGYKILERNYRQPWGELDIVSIASDKTLVFIEVKTVKGDNTIISAESQVTKSKLGKLRRTASMYANQSRYLTDKGWRIDLVAINIIDDKAKIKHYENI